MKLADISVEYIQHAGSDLMVANAARVSFDKHSDILNEKDERLISFLARHKHTSPFNHSFITTRVKAPIFVARQLVKHKFLPWNEVSRRYVDDEPEFYIPDIRVRSESAKQGSGDLHYANEAIKNQIIRASEDALCAYTALLANNVAPEIARAVLPQNMMTTWFWSGTLGAYCDMLRLRLDPHTQAESRIVAEKIKEIITPLFPVSVPALLEVK